VRNDAAFLGTTVLSTSAVAVVAGLVLPGDWRVGGRGGGGGGRREGWLSTVGPGPTLHCGRIPPAGP